MNTPPLTAPEKGPLSPEAEVRRIVDHVAHLLPAQGPLRVFVHHNTLHAFEDLPFEEAIVRAGERFGCKPYREEEDYHREWLRGRILTEDLRSVLAQDLAGRATETVAENTTRLELRLASLAVGLHEPDEKELDWYLNESDKPMDQDLWDACLKAVQPLGPLTLPTSQRVRYRDKLLALTGEDMDALVHPLLIRFCAAFSDQGIAYWRLPSRSLGFFGSFRQLYRESLLPDAWLRGFNARLRKRDDPAASLVTSLVNLGIPREEWEPYLEEMMLALRGWPGMIRQNEERPDRVLIPSPPGSLLEFAAVRILLEEQAVHYLLARHHLSIPTLRQAPPEIPVKTLNLRAYTLYQTAQLLGWPAEKIQTLQRSPLPRGPQTEGQVVGMPRLEVKSQNGLGSLLDEMESFSPLKRRRLWHLAYERRYRIKTLDALLSNTGKPQPLSPGRQAVGRALGVPGQETKSQNDPDARFQAVCCIDEREESFRRHLEEIEPDCETFGTAGFFGLAMYYQGVEDAHAVPLCPILIKPTHSVKEIPLEAEPQSFRQAVGHATYAFHVGSRTGVRGALLSGVFGTLASIPLVLRVFFPRHAAKLRLNLRDASSKTRLEWNYKMDEQTDIVRRLLEETGLRGRLRRLVMIVGHGSSSLNNPHESAHDCGACGGGRGGPNARVFALMANNPEVRERLGIPKDTFFVGAYHNTCNDLIEYYDLDQVPSSHEADLALAQKSLDQAAALSAQERSRRFDNVPLDITPLGALTAMADRTEDLAQVRPEYGHATNAVAVVGRRSLTRNLFMDRRAFLASYDPDYDEDGTILTRVLQAVGPVCAGINLEYYFSFTDRLGYGCGTKLPHNITGMLGVMDGHASDLRTGLPWQMVEIHEPVRLLLVVETPVSRLQTALSRLPTLDRLVKNRWIQLAALEPGTKQIRLFQDGRFDPYQPENHELPTVPASIQWYRGKRGHLDYARITP